VFFPFDISIHDQQELMSRQRKHRRELHNYSTYLDRCPNKSYGPKHVHRAADNNYAENDKERYGNDEHGQPIGSKFNNHQQCIIHIIQHLFISFQTFTQSHRRSACFAKHGGKPIATRVSTMAAGRCRLHGCPFFYLKTYCRLLHHMSNSSFTPLER